MVVTTVDVIDIDATATSTDLQEKDGEMLQIFTSLTPLGPGSGENSPSVSGTVKDL